MQIAEKVFSKMVKGSGNVVRNVKSHVSAMSILSGDVLLRERTPTGAIRVMLGDFTGHGLSAAIGAPQVCDLFFSMTEKGFSVAEVVGGGFRS
jgi:hypothetical protein